MDAKDILIVYLIGVSFTAMVYGIFHAEDTAPYVFILGPLLWPLSLIAGAVYAGINMAHKRKAAQ